MDFSPEVLIDFGLNLAGYIIVVLLTYLLLGRRARRQERFSEVEASKAVPGSTGKPAMEKVRPTRAGIEDPEFIPLAHQSDGKPERGNREASVTGSRATRPVAPLTAATRQENRRAIYQEARRLMASGRSRHDLLRQLPLTEGELEMLSVAGKA